MIKLKRLTKSQIMINLYLFIVIISLTFFSYSPAQSDHIKRHSLYLLKSCKSQKIDMNAFQFPAFWMMQHIFKWKWGLSSKRQTIENPGKGGGISNLKKTYNCFWTKSNGWYTAFGLITFLLTSNPKTSLGVLCHPPTPVCIYVYPLGKQAIHSKPSLP